MSAVVFINYRRDDAAAEARLIAKSLSSVLGDDAVFFDYGTLATVLQLEPGATWPQRIQDALHNSQYVLVIIGPKWLSVCDEWHRRRIDNQSDWVRQEIATALRQEKILIPVVVGGGSIPPEHALPSDVAAILSKQKLRSVGITWTRISSR